jgi:BRCT domain type II-containing protein
MAKTTTKSTKKATAKATDKPVVKKATTKTTDKPVAKKTTAPKKDAKPVKSTGNKELDKMLATIKEATKKGDKSVVVFTTNRSHHKAKTSEMGISVSDLKPKFLEAYKHLFCKFDMSTKLVDIEEMAVEWIVKLK